MFIKYILFSPIVIPWFLDFCEGLVPGPQDTQLLGYPSPLCKSVQYLHMPYIYIQAIAGQASHHFVHMDSARCSARGKFILWFLEFSETSPLKYFWAMIGWIHGCGTHSSWGLTVIWKWSLIMLQQQVLPLLLPFPSATRYECLSWARHATKNIYFLIPLLGRYVFSWT